MMFPLIPRKSYHAENAKLTVFVWSILSLWNIQRIMFDVPCSSMNSSLINNGSHKLSPKFLHVGVSNDYFYIFIF